MNFQGFLTGALAAGAGALRGHNERQKRLHDEAQQQFKNQIAMAGVLAENPHVNFGFEDDEQPQQQPATGQRPAGWGPLRPPNTAIGATQRAMNMMGIAPGMPEGDGAIGRQVARRLGLRPSGTPAAGGVASAPAASERADYRAGLVRSPPQPAGTGVLRAISDNVQRRVATLETGASSAAPQQPQQPHQLGTGQQTAPEPHSDVRRMRIRNPDGDGYFTMEIDPSRTKEGREAAEDRAAYSAGGWQQRGMSYDQARGRWAAINAEAITRGDRTDIDQEANQRRYGRLPPWLRERTGAYDPSRDYRPIEDKYISGEITQHGVRETRFMFPPQQGSDGVRELTRLQARNIAREQAIARVKNRVRQSGRLGGMKAEDYMAISQESGGALSRTEAAQIAGQEFRAMIADMQDGIDVGLTPKQLRTPPGFR